MKMAIIGAQGHYGFALEALQLDPELHLEGVSRSRPGEELGGVAAGAQKYGAPVFEDYRVMLDAVQPDVAVVNPYFCDTADVSMECLKRGIHVFSEKPLATRLDRLDALEETWRASGRALAGMFNLRYCGWFLTVKQAASAAHQQGCPGVTSELYGVTNWDFDFKGHKLQGDWQAALGVTVRVPHLYWCSMHGESKRDYPASIGHQSAWWREYPFIENHFARVNTLMTRGKPRIRIGLIHPVESCWIAYGPDDRTGLKRAELDRRFNEITRWLLEDTLDFDYICESTLPKLIREGEKEKFTVGEMAYDVVIVP